MLALRKSLFCRYVPVAVNQDPLLRNHPGLCWHPRISVPLVCIDRIIELGACKHLTFQVRALVQLVQKQVRNCTIRWLDQ